MKLSGNTVLITGGAAGIGFALAQRFAEEGSRVLVCDLGEDRLRQAREKLPGLEWMVCDVSVQSQREALRDWAVEQGVNVLVNNAGVQKDVDLKKGMEDLRNNPEIAVNFQAPVILSALFVPHLMRQERAAIVNITSGLAFMLRPRPTVGIYTATKVALHCFTQALRGQMEGTPVRVFELIAPIVDTGINPESRRLRPGPHGIPPEQLASIAMEGLREDRYIIRSLPEHYPNPLTLLHEDVY